jgi:ABC-type transporter Mla MlaB component
VITKRDLDVISPPPPRVRRVRAGRGPIEKPPGLDEPSDAAPVAGSPTVAAVPSTAAAPVSISATLTISGPCTRPVLDALRDHTSALLAAGARELVVDLSEVTDPNLGLLRTLSRIQRRVEHDHASLTLTGAPDALGAVLDTATLTQAFLIYRSLSHPPDERGPTPGHIDPGALAMGLTTSGPGRA